MIIKGIHNLKNELKTFDNYDCVVIICKYNGGKSSIATDLIHGHFGDKNTYYATFIDQEKPNFLPRKSRLKFGELIKNKVVVFDEISNDNEGDVTNYINELIKYNLLIILTNPYGGSNNSDNEIALFMETESQIIPDNTLFIFVEN